MTKYLLILTLLASIFLTGCSSLHEVPASSSASVSQNLKVGDTVKITKLSNDVLEFEIEGITGKRVFGEGISVDISDIGKIEKKEFSVFKTLSLSSGLAILGAMGILIIAL
ncbi:hypothetical protein L2747_05055 [Shewanella marinintestina]|uniref:hypothetical protein n=1 Tax=Shewanella marinintestina TaxID=190305 RepID=UPI00200D5ED0|nr:hypothetical protein [Shewanella marinintestina]MCL1145386.1 hypothetical protein [Shewanella marinintestina]